MAVSRATIRFQPAGDRLDRDWGHENCQEGGMSNRPARVTQAEIERAIRAAKKLGLTEVEVRLGDEASIRIPLVPEKPVAEPGEIVL